MWQFFNFYIEEIQDNNFLIYSSSHSSFNLAIGIYEIYCYAIINSFSQISLDLWIY